ncbi:MAG: PSD1 and planctomycete cytochrome C domain-containing protein [Planctomycetia bacterium]
MRTTTWLIPIVLAGGPLVGLPPAASGSDAETISAGHLEFFEKLVRPLRVKRCFECHGGTQAEGGLSLASSAGWKTGGDSGPTIVPGKPADSLLIDAVNHRGLEMPPAERGGKLPAEEIAILTQWVAMGAPDPRAGEVLGGMTRGEAQAWWAFQPLPAGGSLQDGEIDTLLAREWGPRHLTPVPLADTRTLIRRATSDHTGLPPTREETRRFLADESPDAFAKLVDRLLESPQYGVHWGRHWLDVVRYGDTAGENTDRPLPHAWRYRNWVFDAFQRDMPFDEFVRLQVAGDLLAPDRERRPENIVATGYLAIARRFGHDIDKDMHLTHEDVIDNLGRNFLGLSLGCARCHDHKYDPVTAADYYALYGIFASTRFAFSGCEAQGQPRDLVPLLAQDEIEAFLRPWRARQERARGEWQERVEAARRSLSAASLRPAHLVQHGAVKEGAAVDIAATPVAIRKGEVLLLAVEAGASHGSDSTLVELRIRQTGGRRSEWSTRDVIDSLTRGNPRDADEAAWCFIELAPDGPAFLLDRADSVDGNSSLKKWSLGDLPSVFVNSADQQVMAWTTLAAKSFFVHPAPGKAVAVAWVSPLDGEVTVEGRVADAHPAALDGVTFRLEHIARAAAGAALLEAGRTLAAAAPTPEPQPAIPVAYAVGDREAATNARVQERGEPATLGDEVPRRWLSAFGGAEVPQDAGSGRRELAAWITAHPLLPRVTVNRIWGWHFGRGLVASANDFGSRGERPTHPELLDRLAVDFVQGGYGIKSLHRRIMLSEAYRRASATPADEDPDNRWLTRFTRRRLTAEEIRDSLLAISGRIDLSPGEGHPFPAEKAWNFTQHKPFSAVYDTDRRSAFLMVQRQQRHPFLALFDGADPNASTPSRQTTTVPTQALYFMNDPFFHRQAAATAERLASSGNENERLANLFQAAYQRDPSAAERDRFLHLVAGYPGTAADRWAAVCRVLLASNEFLHVE